MKMKLILGLGVFFLSVSVECAKRCMDKTLKESRNGEVKVLNHYLLKFLGNTLTFSPDKNFITICRDYERYIDDDIAKFVRGVLGKCNNKNLKHQTEIFKSGYKGSVNYICRKNYYYNMTSQQNVNKCTDVIEKPLYECLKEYPLTALTDYSEKFCKFMDY